MNFRTSMKSSYIAVGSAFEAVTHVASTVSKGCEYVESYVDEALEVQSQTRQVRVKKAVLEAKRDLVSDLVALTEEEKALIAELEN